MLEPTESPARIIRGLLTMDWEPETQALIDAAGLEVTPAKVNVAVRQWLRQILRHREYLRKVK